MGMEREYDIKNRQKKLPNLTINLIQEVTDKLKTISEFKVNNSEAVLELSSREVSSRERDEGVRFGQFDE